MITSARCAISMASSRVTWLMLSSPSLSRMMARRTGPFRSSFSSLSRQAKYSASYMAVPPPGRSARTPRESASVLSVKFWVTSGVTSKPTTKALSYRGRIVWLRNSMADFLLELEAVAHRVAGIDQQSDLQRQLGFVVKAANLLGGPVVVDDRKIALGQVLHVVAMPVGHGEDDVHFVHRLGDRGGGVIGVLES